MLIALEGADCVGKTTLADALAAAITATLDRRTELLTFPSTSFPGWLARACLGVASGQWREISSAPGASAYLIQSLMIADRYSRVGEIQDHIRKSGVVLAVRWIASGEVYGALDGVDSTWIRRAQQMLPEPDLTILLDADVATATERQKERNRPADVYENPDFQARVIESYRALWKKNCTGVQRPTWVRLDAKRMPAELKTAALAAIHKCARAKWDMP